MIVRYLQRARNQFASLAVWRIHPVVNPDGYHYTYTKDRYWRNTRSGNSTSAECQGADANRNFDTPEFFCTYEGDAGRASPADPCSLTFYGDYAFSEIETRASRDALLGNRTEFFFDLHSYGTMWMFPCGHTDARVPEYDQLPQNTYVFNSNGFLSISLQLNISRRAAEAIEKVNGAVYKVGAMYETIYPMSGGSTDWAYDKAGGILPTVTEAWEGIKAAVLY
ncbi:hypothetical protein MRX96_021919 [Rhipicephalus microplus]